MSSLCLGRRDRSGQAGNDTFYLPSCNLLVRRQAFAASRGFREELHVGEDVDLTWRLRDAGGKIVYTPRGRVFHEHRSRLWPFLRRRFQYGTSEGLLQLLHPERRKKMVLPVALAAAAALAVLSFLTRSWPFVAVGAGVLLVDAARLSAKLRRERLRLPFRSILAARLRACASLVYYLSFHLTRYYAPALICGVRPGLGSAHSSRSWRCGPAPSITPRRPPSIPGVLRPVSRRAPVLRRRRVLGVPAAGHLRQLSAADLGERLRRPRTRVRMDRSGASDGDG